MRAKRLSTILVGFILAATAAIVLHLDALTAAPTTRTIAMSTTSTTPPNPATRPAATPMPLSSATPVAACIPPPMQLALAFTASVSDTSALDLRLPWGRPGDPEGRMIEDYGAYDGVAVREQLPVYDVTSGSLRVLYGHNAIDIVLDSGTPLFAVTSGIIYHIENWTIPGAPQGYAAVVVSDVLSDHRGRPIAFLYGHVREFDVANGQHVEAGALIAKSGGGEDDPGRGFSDTPNVHFEVIESGHPLTAHAGTVNPHQFLANLYAHAAACPSGA